MGVGGRVGGGNAGEQAGGSKRRLLPRADPAPPPRRLTLTPQAKKGDPEAKGSRFPALQGDVEQKAGPRRLLWKVSKGKAKQTK